MLDPSFHIPERGPIRLRRYVLGRRMLYALLYRFNGLPDFLPIYEGLQVPEGTKIRGIAHDLPRDAVVLFIEHESFADVGDGDEIPIHGQGPGEFIEGRSVRVIKDWSVELPNSLSVLRKLRDVVSERIYDLEKA